MKAAILIFGIVLGVVGSTVAEQLTGDITAQKSWPPTELLCADREARAMLKVIRDKVLFGIAP